MIGHMSSRTSETWVDKVERTFAFRPARPKLKGAFLLLAIGFLLMGFGNVVRLMYWDDVNSEWVESAPILLFSVLGVVISTAEALYARVFGERLTELGRVLRAISYFFVWPVAILSLTVTGYTFWGFWGALVGFALAVIACIGGLFFDIRRGRTQNRRAAHSERV